MHPGFSILSLALTLAVGVAFMAPVAPVVTGRVSHTRAWLLDLRDRIIADRPALAAEGVESPVYSRGPGYVNAVGILVGGPSGDLSTCQFSPIAAAVNALAGRGLNLTVQTGP
jgi:hypothetical protein